MNYGQITYTVKSITKEGEPYSIEENLNGTITEKHYDEWDIHSKNIFNLARWDYKKKENK